MKYRHLSQVERYQIEAGISLGMTVAQIAKKIRRPRSTVFCELKRNGRFSTEGYHASPAQFRYSWRREKCRPKFRIHGRLKDYVDSALSQKWSPEQISGRYRLDKNSSISVETIYRYIYKDKKNGGTLWNHLRHRRAKRRKRFAHHRWPTKIPRISAQTRPKIIAERLRTGDFERDMIVGCQWSGYILTLVDRKSRLVTLQKPKNLTSAQIHKATLRALSGLTVHSITNDNGVEFIKSQKTSRSLKVPIYFTRPYASWERGTVENTNKLIRQYFPKNMNFKEITDAQVKMVQEALNNRPRKTLQFRTPLEVHFDKTLQQNL